MAPKTVEQDVDRDYLPFVVIAVVGFTLGTVAVVGELLGWWHAFGEVLAFVSYSAGILGLVLPFVVGASKRGLREMRGDVRQVGADVRDLGGDVRQVGAGMGDLRSDVRAGNGALVAEMRAMRTEQREQTELLRALVERTGRG